MYIQRMNHSLYGKRNRKAVMKNNKILVIKQKVEKQTQTKNVVDMLS